MNAIPIALFWGLAAWGIASPKPVLIYLFFATIPLGTLAVLPPAITGGLTFTATPIVSLLIIARAFVNRSGPPAFLTLAILPQRLMLLTLFWFVAVITTIFMPRIFQGSVMVVPMRGILSTTSPLRPTSQNFSQLVYITISIMSVFAFTHILRSRQMRQHALQALCLGGLVTITTGALDFASQFMPITPLLQPFRTATYALLTDVEVMGSKRVVGLMPEASSFGGTCLAFLSTIYFYRRAIADVRFQKVYAPPLLGLLLVFCWLSKSSGTYVGLAVFAIMALLEWFLRINSSERNGAIYRRGLGGEMSFMALAITAILLAVMFRPDILDPIYSLIDRMVFQKGSSVSYEERGMWRSVALASLRETYGLGVGMGGTRASSSAVSVFSSTGVIGGMLFYAFVLQCFLRGTRKATAETRLILAAFRFSFMPGFVTALMVGDADFGGLPAFGFGIVTALAIYQETTVRRSAVQSAPNSFSKS
jgi:hypothetical protein